MYTSLIHKKNENLFKDLKVWEIITFGEQSLELFFISRDITGQGKMFVQGKSGKTPAKLVKFSYLT